MIHTLARGAIAALAISTLVAGGAAPALAQTKLVFSHHIPTSHILHEAAERFGKAVSDKTGGQVTVDIKPAGQLFNLRTSAEALQLGTLDLAWTDLGSLANWQPYLGFTAVPFLFNDFEHANKVVYGPIGEKLRKEVRETLGVEILSLGWSGPRIFMTRKAVKSVNDLQGIKLRVPEIAIYVEMARALGTNPTPIPAGEIYTALQTGVVDGMEAPADFVMSTKIFEVAKFSTRSYHIMTEVSMMASAKKMDSLPAAHAKAVRDAAVEVVQGWYKVENEKIHATAWAQVSERTDANANPDVAAFRAKMGPVQDNFIAKAGPKAKEYIEAVQAAGRK